VKRVLVFVLLLLVGYAVVLPLWRSWRASSLEQKGIEAAREERWPEAARLFEKATAYADDFAGAWYNLGLARLRMNNLEGAAAAFKKELSINFNEPNGLVALGQTQLQLGDYAGAEDSANGVLRLHPTSGLAYYVLGEVYFQTKRMTNAIDAYQQVLRYDEQNAAGAHYNLGRCYAAIGQYPDARKELQEAVRLKPSVLESRLLLGRVLARLGDFAGADEQQRALRAIDRRAAVELLEYIQRTASVSSAKESSASNAAFSSSLNLGDSSDHKAGIEP
jgi:tetratricopeptide (TPR) repeat protein